jgi:dCMP deaminase
MINNIYMPIIYLYNMEESLRRPSWDEYFMRMAYLAASRSNCTRRKVGAVIVRDNNVLATGYNGPPAHTVNCDIVGCIRDELDVPSGERHELCRGLHAEQNAIIQAAVNGSSIKGSKIYVTTHPCVVCSKMIMNSHIGEIIFAEGYPDDLAELMLLESDIKIRKFNLPDSEVESMIGVRYIHKTGED